jgi:hypothetical protein
MELKRCMMIQIITKINTDLLLKYPNKYIGPYSDRIMARVITPDCMSVIVKLKYDKKRESYYFVVKYDEVSENIYCEKEKLRDKFTEIVIKLHKGE